MKQTAVELLIEQITDLIPNDIGSQLKFKNKIEQAKNIEKEQIIDAWLSAWKDSFLEPLEDKYYQPEAEQYYKETFNDK